MRRRKPVGSNVPDALSPDVLPVWLDDTSKPIRARMRAWEGWMEAFQAWRAARLVWAARRGIDAEQLPAYSELIPDAPFDPSSL